MLFGDQASAEKRINEESGRNEIQEIGEPTQKSDKRKSQVQRETIQFGTKTWRVLREKHLKKTSDQWNIGYD